MIKILYLFQELTNYKICYSAILYQLTVHLTIVFSLYEKL